MRKQAQRWEVGSLRSYNYQTLSHAYVFLPEFKQKCIFVSFSEKGLKCWLFCRSINSFGYFN